LGDRAAAALADRVVVDLADRRHLGGGAREEELVGAVELAARDVADLDVEAQVLRDGEDRVPRDAGEDGAVGAGRDQTALHDEEEVLAAALGHVAVAVEEDRLLEALLAR